MKSTLHHISLSAALSAGLFFTQTTGAVAGEALEDFAAIMTLKESGKTTDFAEAAEKFLTDHPASSGEVLVLLYLGQNYHTQKQYDDSIRVLSKLLEDHPESSSVTAAAMQRGESYRLTEKHAEMLPDFQKAYEGYKKAGDANAAHAQFHIVQAYNFLKETEKATAQAEMLLKDYPSTSYAKNGAQLMKLKMPAAEAPKPTGLATGTVAPDIDMIILSDGATKKLSEFQGKVVVLDFWASWCGPCQAPMAKMQTYREMHPDWGDKVELIALSIDNTAELASGHLKKNGWDKTLNAWAGEGGFRAKPPAAYQIRGIPTVYVIDAEGKVAATGHPSSIDVSEIVSGLLKKG